MSRQSFNNYSQQSGVYQRQDKARPSHTDDAFGPLEARRMRKAIQRRTIDFNALVIREIEVFVLY